MGPGQWSGQHSLVTNMPPLSPEWVILGSSRVSVERRALLPLESHYQQRKSAQGASDRAFPPSTESFRIPQGLPAQSQIPGTQDQSQKERTQGT